MASPSAHAAWHPGDLGWGGIGAHCFSSHRPALWQVLKMSLWDELEVGLGSRVYGG